MTEVFADDCWEIFWLSAWGAACAPADGSDGADWRWLVVLLDPLAGVPSGTAGELSIRAGVEMGVRGVFGDHACQQGVR